MKARIVAGVGLLAIAGLFFVLPISCGDSAGPAVRDGGGADTNSLCAHCGSQDCCNGVCTDTSSDTGNCGGCGNACLPNSPAPDCVGGQCSCSAMGAPCNAGDTCCAGGCKNTQTDKDNCGNCGVKCANNQTCNNGTCSCGGTTCQSGMLCCNNACINPKTDVNNCGYCGNKCPSGQNCTNGLCGGNNNCGPGGTACPAGQICCPNVCCPQAQCFGGNVCQGGYDAGV